METKLETRTAKRDGAFGFIVSVVNGPQDLLWRSTEEYALRDGAAYVDAYYRRTEDGWVAK